MFNNSALFTMLDAPTGTGKSIIAIGSSQYLKYSHGQGNSFRTIYVTPTIQLQQQIKEDGFEVKVLMGKDNYKCVAFPNLLNHEVKCSECPFDSQTNPQKPPLCNHCEYRIARIEALSAPLVVMNYAYYLREINGPHKFANADMVIMDEVDCLEAHLQNIINLTVSSDKCKLYGLPQPRGCETIKDWQNWAETSIEVIQEYIDRLESTFPTYPGNWTSRDIKGRRRVKTADEFLKSLITFANESDDAWIIDPGEEQKNWKITLKPVMVAGYAKKYLWRHGKRFIGMSGTILDPKSQAGDLGLDDKTTYTYRQVPSYYPKEIRWIYYTPVANLVHGVMEEETPKMITEVARLLKLHPDINILVHTVSYDLRDKLMDQLPQFGLSPDRLMTHDEKNRKDKLKEFKDARGKIMVSPSFDRGCDLPGDECRLQIICKVPFMKMGDAQVKARLALSGGRRWYNLRAIQTMMQMSGRGVRGEKDGCVTYILDKAWERLYRQTKHLIPQWWKEAIKNGGPEDE